MANTIYVGGLPYEATEEGLKGLIEPHGGVRSIALPRDAQTGQTLGYAFVEMADETTLSDLVHALKGVKMDDHLLSVSLIACTEEGSAPRGMAGPAQIASPEKALLTWERLDRWLEMNATALWYSLYPVALEEDIVRAETHLGLTLHADLHIAYRRHNGQDNPPLFPGGFKFCTLLEVMDLWDLQNRMATQFNDPTYWHPKWVPLTCNDSGSFHFANLNPDDPDCGRIFLWCHEGSPGPHAENFTAMVEDLAEGLEYRKYVADDTGVAEAAARWI